MEQTWLLQVVECSGFWTCAVFFFVHSFAQRKMEQMLEFLCVLGVRRRTCAWQVTRQLR